MGQQPSQVHCFTAGAIRRRLQDIPEIVLAPMMHYTSSYLGAKAIMRDHLLHPGQQDPGSLSGSLEGVFCTPRVNVTDVLPESGKAMVAAETGLDERDVRYGIELLIPKHRLTQMIEGFPHAYQVLTKESVWIWPIRLWHMDEVQRRLQNGLQIVRYTGKGGFPLAHWERAQQHPHHGHGQYSLKNVIDRLA